MKKTLLIALILVAGTQLVAKEKIEIAASESIELTYEEFARYDVQLSSRSSGEIKVAEIDPASGEQVSGFGLAPRGKVVLSVQTGNILKLENTSSKDVSVVLTFVDRVEKEEAVSTRKSVTFTLHNSSMKSIPLVIPGVMNPNLSPMSNSGVALKMGQKIYYKDGMRKVLVLTVDKSIKDGAKIDMAQLITEID